MWPTGNGWEHEVLRELGDRGLTSSNECWPQDEVFGRIAADGEFWRNDQFCALLCGTSDRRGDHRRIAGEVTDGGIYLGEREAHEYSLLRFGYPARRLCECDRNARVERDRSLHAGGLGCPRAIGINTVQDCDDSVTRATEVRSCLLNSSC